MQGAHSRRNYTGLFHQLVPRPDIVNNPRFQLQTYTWHTLDPTIIPEEVAPKVVGKTLYHFPVSNEASHHGAKHTDLCDGPNFI